MVVINEADYIEHYGTPRHSGRYPWGSGNNVPGGDESDNELHRNMSFLDTVKYLKSKGLSDKAIADGYGISLNQLRAKKTIQRAEHKQSEIAQAKALRDKGWSHDAIAKRMNLSGESYVRTLLADDALDKANILTKTANMLKEEVDSKGLIQIGSGVEHHLDMSAEKLRAAVDILKEKGYVDHVLKVPQLGTGKETKVKVLAPPGTTWGEAQKNIDNVKLPGQFSTDGGRSFTKVHDPISISPNRVMVKYKEEGGAEADGIIFVRPGVPDVSIGDSHYAQVRIQVGDGHYLKGMAMYKDGLPPGTDLVFHTKKSSTGNKLDAMKELSTKDPDYPFESIVRQQIVDKGTPNERVVSVMNIVGTKPGAGTEGDWGTWTKTLSSQFLSKQRPSLVKEQLDKTYERQKKEFDEINSLTNPTVKKALLDKFADSTDSKAADLKATSLPRQSWHVILPVNSLKPNEIYAPGFHDGERVALVRFPHGGTFEIPELTVNNKHPEARKLLGPNPSDAVGIHHSVAERLSGADFDGDTVLVIPNRSNKVKSTPALEGLKGFDPIASYPKYEGMHVMTDAEKGLEMGKISNLITDMTIKGAPQREIAQAIRHSMVVIDAKKHELNYKESYNKNGIAALKKTYQSGSGKGAATLISRATSRLDVPDRKDRPHSEGGPIDPKTGRRMFVETGKVGFKGKPITFTTTKLAEAQDAHDLVSKPVGTPVEKLYANHSNKLKALANEARLTSFKTPSPRRSASAAKVYKDEVASLTSKLKLAEMNSPLERQAQIIANAHLKSKRASNPGLDKASIKKEGFVQLELARARMQSSKKERSIEITPREWDAIQAGAIGHSKLSRILQNTDVEKLRKLATPRKQVLMTDRNVRLAKSLLDSGYTRAQVADRLGVSLSTLDRSTVE